MLMHLLMFDDNSENMSIEFSRCVSFKCIYSTINIIDPNNIESIAGAIDRIIACPSQQIESMRLSSIESSRAQFSAKAFTDKYINIV